jgi:hypothetical protein
MLESWMPRSVHAVSDLWVEVISNFLHHRLMKEELACGPRLFGTLTVVYARRVLACFLAPGHIHAM